MWILQKKIFSENLSKITIDWEDYILITDEEFERIKTQEAEIIIFGTIWPRVSEQSNYSKINNFKNWITNLYLENGLNFINKIKGDFCILIYEKGNIFCFNDYFGFTPIYISEDNSMISNDFCVISKLYNEINYNAIPEHILYNRLIKESTFLKNVKNLQGANKIQFNYNQINREKYWKPKQIQKNKINKNITIKYLVNLISSNTSFFFNFYLPNKTVVTLTGGKDSRSALAAMLHSKIKPTGISYGNPDSKDVVYAKKIANELNLPFINKNLDQNSSQLNIIVNELLEKHPMKSIHRAHRFYAFKSFEKVSDEKSVLFNGYLGGELLMGIYPDKLVFSDFILQKINKSKNKMKFSVENSFYTESLIKLIDLESQKIEDEISDFEAIFLIGITHHLQDIHLAKENFNYVFSFFLDIDFLEALFQSKYNFQNLNNQTKNLIKRHKLYELNMSIQDNLAPQVGKVPYAKKGNYTLKDYKSGPILWSLKKVLNFVNEKKFPANYVYNEYYISWLKEQLITILEDDETTIHNYFNVKKALTELESFKEKSYSELSLNRFSRIVEFYYFLNSKK
jgi:asparagine synthetase B (glutamine-hydrolysing)